MKENKMNYPGSLHNHSDYSNLRLRDCINKLDDLFGYAGELGHEVVALTDHESISGGVKAQKIATKLKSVPTRVARNNAKLKTTSRG